MSVHIHTQLCNHCPDRDPGYLTWSKCCFELYHHTLILFMSFIHLESLYILLYVFFTQNQIYEMHSCCIHVAAYSLSLPCRAVSLIWFSLSVSVEEIDTWAAYNLKPLRKSSSISLHVFSSYAVLITSSIYPGIHLEGFGKSICLPSVFIIHFLRKSHNLPSHQ